MTRNYGKKTIQRKWKKQNIIKYINWSVREIVPKGEKLDSVLNEKQIKVSTITEPKKKLKGTTETNNYTLMYSGVNRSP